METENVCVSEGSIISLYLLMTLCSRINRFKTKALGKKGGGEGLMFPGNRLWKRFTL